jgi:FtsH-binding integral membrane protein
MDKIIKIGLSFLLLLCLADMPYGFFQLIRFLSLIGFAILAFEANKKEKQTEIIIYIGLAILFQPLFKISLGRTIWNIVDVIVAVGLILSLLGLTNDEKKH